MGASKRKQLVNSHVKNYVQAVFADRLKEEGFVDVEDRSICWYRLKNSDIINTIVFNSCWNDFPVFLEIGYGIHPLFAEPVFSRNSYIPRQVIDCLHDNERFANQILWGATGNVPFSENASVYTTEDNGLGIDVFNNILLPKMDGINSIDDCYRLHKGYHTNIVKGRELTFDTVSRTFIDEAIYVNDVEIYSQLSALVKKRIANCSMYFEKFPNIKAYGEALAHYQQQYSAISKGGRDEYMEILEQRKKKTVAKLSKKFGIE